MNENKVRFTPYTDQAFQNEFGSIPEVSYQIHEMQCYNVYQLIWARYVL